MRYDYLAIQYPDHKSLNINYILVDLRHNKTVAYFSTKEDVINTMIALNSYENDLEQLRKYKETKCSAQPKGDCHDI